jgi:hypothetical protein
MFVMGPRETSRRTHDRPTTVAYWVAIALTALAIRVVVAIFLCGDLADSLSYAKQAQDMMTGNWNYPNYWPAGRSLGLVPFLWAFGTSEAVIKANSIAFDLGSVILAAVLAHQVLRRRSTARLAGWIAALYPPMILQSPWSYSQNTTAFFLLAFSILVIAACRRDETSSWRRLAASFASGCSLGVAILTRPSTQSVFVLGTAGCVGFLILRQIKPSLFPTTSQISWKIVCSAGLTFVLGVLGCIAPVLRHNASLDAGWVLSVNNELNCLLGNNPYTPHYNTWHLGESRAESPEFQAYLSRFRGKDVPRSAMVYEALRYIAERPDIFLLRTTNRIRAFWGFDYISSAKLKGKCGKAELLAAFAAEGGGYCFVMLLAIGGLFLYRTVMDAKYAAFLIAVVLAYQLPYALTHCNGSYHFPLLGLIFPFAAVTLDETRRRGIEVWRILRAAKWFWIASVVFILIQLEYAYQVLLYH